MNVPLQISFHNVPASEVIEARVREQAHSLDNIYGRITSCRVVIDVPHKHHKGVNGHHVRIDLIVPHAELVVKQGPDDHTDLDSVILAAFEDMRRQLEDHVERARGFVKNHDTSPRGKVARVFPDRGFGFLETADGREIYFHQNSVLNGGFGRLHVGSEVAFAEELGEKGPQASTVRLVGRRNGS